MSTPAPLTATGRTGILTVNSIVLSGPAWDTPDLSMLWVDAAQRGANRRVSGTPGVRFKRKRYDESPALIPLLVIGHFDPAGAVQANAMLGLQLNLETLRAGLVEPTVTGAVSVAASLARPGGGGTPRTADVQCDLRVGDLRGGRVIGGVPTVARCICVLALTIDGRFD